MCIYNLSENSVSKLLSGPKYHHNKKKKVQIHSKQTTDIYITEPTTYLNLQTIAQKLNDQ